MKSKSVYSTKISDTVTVSTVRVYDGRAQWYETSVIINGKVSDGVRNHSKFDAGFEHDETVAWFLYPSTRLPTKRDARLRVFEGAVL